MKPQDIPLTLLNFNVAPHSDLELKGIFTTQCHSGYKSSLNFAHLNVRYSMKFEIFIQIQLRCLTWDCKKGFLSAN